MVKISEGFKFKCRFFGGLSLSTLYLTVSGIIMPSLKLIGQPNMHKLTVRAIRNGRTDVEIDHYRKSLLLKTKVIF